MNVVSDIFVGEYCVCSVCWCDWVMCCL